MRRCITLWVPQAGCGCVRRRCHPQAKRAHRRRYGEAAKGYFLGLSLFSARIIPITLNLKLGHCGLLTRPRALLMPDDRSPLQSPTHTNAPAPEPPKAGAFRLRSRMAKRRTAQTTGSDKEGR